MLKNQSGKLPHLKSVLTEAFNHHDSPTSKIAQALIVAATVISVAVTILNSVPRFETYATQFLFIEHSCATFFMFEFMARLWTSPHKRKYLFSFWGFIDILSFVPLLVVFFPLPAAMVAQQLKVLLVIRAFRIGKFTRAYVEGVRSEETHDASHELNVKVYFLALFSAAIGNGAVMYAIEGHQPHYSTIPKAILEVLKIFMATAAWPTQTLFGELFILCVRFQALCLLGLLIEVMGNFMRNILFGHGDTSHHAKEDAVKSSALSRDDG